jgi:2-keto-3-deoxy-6-phosphogluconate aldolase
MTTDSPATTDTRGTAQPPESSDAPGTKDGLGATEARIRTARIIAFLRIDRADRIVDTSRVPAGEGLTVEIAMDRPHAIASIGGVRETLGDDALPGAVLHERAADDAEPAGTYFCVAPSLDSGMAAGRLGLQFLNLFPCGAQMLDFVRALRGRFSAVGFVPTGGIGLSAVPACLEAGAAVVGLRSALVRPDDSLADLAARGRRLTERVCERGARR